MRTSNELRQSFLDFFASKGHHAQPGISLVPTDPSLFLTGAGVVPFRAVIEGREKPAHLRVATCQRCVRTNDIENVGKFARYHTFFEMLGNFSFGDYYKQESLVWGWEFITETMKLDPDRIWGTIYPDDEEAFGIWTKDIGLPAERVLRLEDNFWGPVAETGACGPDSEVFYDLGPEYGCGNPDCQPGCECDRYLEFWNHVFTELHKNEDGSFKPLPHRNIDTGMGLERLTCLVQGVESVYETDLFAPILDTVDALIASATGQTGSRDDWRKRVVADHARAITFLVMDGIYPSNSGRGYVLRRVLRRAATYGRLLGIDHTFLHELVPVVIEKMSPGYPELPEKAEVITRIVSGEEQKYAEALERGMPIFLQRAEKEAEGIIDGAFAFDIYQTYGLPRELQYELAAEYGAAIDERGWDRAESAHRETSGAGVAVKELGVALDLAETEFLGYDELEAEGEVLSVLVDGEAVESIEAGGEGLVALDRTPCYGESGGQVGDTGRMTDGGMIATVLDTQKYDGVYVHHVRVEEGAIHTGMRLRTEVDAGRREAIQRAHTATHLLHAALRQTLGDHVVQRGSVVEADRLRFDFAHDEAVSPVELRRIEQIVNAAVLENIELEIAEKPLAEAREMGAMALFGEKYGEVVRVVQIPGTSIELCGGTHVARIGDIGLISISSEGSVGAGVRRIHATSGMASLAHLQRLDGQLHDAAAALATGPDSLLARILAQEQTISDLRKQVAEARETQAGGLVESLLAEAVEVEGVPVLAATVEIDDASAVKALVDTLMERQGDGVVVLGATTNGKGLFIGKVSADQVKSGLHAGNLIREVAKRAGGGGGGRPNFAQAGAKDASRVPEAVQAVPELVRAQLQG